MNEQLTITDDAEATTAEASQAAAAEATGRRAKARKAGGRLLRALLLPAVGPSTKIDHLATTLRAPRTPSHTTWHERPPQTPGRSDAEVIGGVANLVKTAAQAARGPRIVKDQGGRLRQVWQDPDVRTAALGAFVGTENPLYRAHVKRQTSRQQAGSQAETAPAAAAPGTTEAGAPASVAPVVEAAAGQPTQTAAVEAAQPPLDQQPQIQHNAVPPNPEA